LWKFRSLPNPLRLILGLEAWLLDRVNRRLAGSSRRLLYVPIPLAHQSRELAADRFHPSRAGYQTIASHLARAIARTV
jgi:lysophospholipase L1-like esterase